MCILYRLSIIHLTLDAQNAEPVAAIVHLDVRVLSKLGNWGWLHQYHAMAGDL